MIGDGRAPGAPPIDSLAEALVLHHVVCLHPHHIDQLNLERLLVLREHREAWRAAVRVRRQYPTAGVGELYVPWLQEMWSNVPGGDLIVETICAAPRENWGRAEEEWLRADIAGSGLTEYLHGFDWWLRRLERIAEARCGIRAAQEIAEGFFRVPDCDYGPENAHAALRRLVPIRDDSIGMEVPV